MTNIVKNHKKFELKSHPFEIGIQTLEAHRWTVTRATGMQKTSVRRISNGRGSLLASIRTSQDRWIPLPPKENPKGRITLDDVSVVVAASVDDDEPPREAVVHWLKGGRTAYEI